MRGIRGATQATENTREAIEEAVVELCQELTKRNRLKPEEIVWAIFTVTHDLDADFPARGARVQGWHQVPMICSQEIPVPGSMPRVIRVLLHASSKGAPHHVYMRGAQALRPDLHHGVPFAQPSAAAAAPRRRTAKSPGSSRSASGPGARPSRRGRR
ncbi:MAG TPA: chorismate mutase [Anaeromyxobacteraceae bacterium]|nr:chorismate mutase [Anaeromyxobacteraceae bacterium]